MTRRWTPNAYNLCAHCGKPKGRTFDHHACSVALQQANQGNKPRKPRHFERLTDYLCKVTN